MNHHVAIIHHDPAIACQTLFFAFLAVFGSHIVQRRVGQRVQHAIAGAAADDEIIGKGNNLFDINKDDILPLFIFQGIYDFTCKVECIQESPLLKITL